MVEPAAAISIIGGIGAVLKIIDQVTNQFKSLKSDDSALPDTPDYSVTSEIRNDEIILHRAGAEYPLVTIVELRSQDAMTANDIKALEDAITQAHDIWSQVYPQWRGEINPITKAQLKQQLDRLVAEMCQDFNHLLDFIVSLGKSLDDHYMAVRDLCQQP